MFLNRPRGSDQCVCNSLVGIRVGNEPWDFQSTLAERFTDELRGLAEGCSRRTRPEFLRFVEIALGSLNGLDAQLSLARDAGVLTTESCAPCERHIVVTRRMLISLSRTLQRRIAEEAATALAAVEEPAP